MSRLAARHAIKVSLRRSVYGGTTAVVLMPFGVVVRQEEASRAAPWDGRPAEGGPRSLTGRHRLPPSPAVAAQPAGPGPGVRTGEAAWPMAPWETGPITMPSEAAAAGPAPALSPPLAPPSPPQAPASPVAAAPASASGSHLGMPIRVPQASMAPQLRDQRGADLRDLQDLQDLQAAEDDVPWFGARSPEATRSMLTMMQQGWRRGRMDDLDDPEGVPGMGTD